LAVFCSNANTNDTDVRVGFALATLPAEPASGATADDILLHHPNIAAGSGVVMGDGSGIIGFGADNEDLRITVSDPGGEVSVQVSWYEIES
ncbi:MAG: hypothetical protein V3W28_06345, partial [Thermoplasmata archaeon]